MRPPKRTRNAPEKLEAHPPDSKHELMSVRKKKKYEKKKQRDFKRNQRENKEINEGDKRVTKQGQGDHQPAGQEGDHQQAGQGSDHHTEEQGDNHPAV